MKQAVVTVFLVRGVSQAAEPGLKFDVTASSDDGLREAAANALAERGLSIRALSFGPGGLIAYAEAAR